MGCGERRERKHESEVRRQRKRVLSICGALTHTWGTTESRSSIVWKWHKHKFSGKLLNSS